MEYGTQKTISTRGNQIMADVVKYRRGEIAKTIRNYRVKVKVISAQDEMSEFIRFTDELSRLRKEGKLTVDKDDATTFPAFIIHYPKEDLDGSYFVIKSYTVVV